MSTTFGAIKKQYLQDKKVVKALKEWIKNNDTNAFIEGILKENMFIEVAFRDNFYHAYLFETGEILPGNEFVATAVNPVFFITIVACKINSLCKYQAYRSR